MVKKFRKYLYSFWHNSRTWRTDRQTDRQTPHDDIGRAYASHRAAKIDCRLLVVDAAKRASNASSSPRQQTTSSRCSQVEIRSLFSLFHFLKYSNRYSSLLLEFLSRVSTLTRDIGIAFCLYVRAGFFSDTDLRTVGPRRTRCKGFKRN